MFYEKYLYFKKIVKIIDWGWSGLGQPGWEGRGMGNLWANPTLRGWSGPQCMSKQLVVSVALAVQVLGSPGFYIYRYFSMMLHQHLLSSSFLKVSCSTELETISMNLSYLNLIPLLQLALWRIFYTYMS